MPQVDMHDIAPRAFLALMNLARKQTEETLSCARKHYPECTDEELLQLAGDAERQRNRDLLSIAVKVPPTRKVSCWSREGEVVTAILECGHVTRVRPNQTARVARCRRCLEEENRDIVENLSGQTELASGRT